MARHKTVRVVHYTPAEAAGEKLFGLLVKGFWGLVGLVVLWRIFG